jgi:hypothetical protein
MLHLTRNSVVIAYAVGIALAAAMVMCHWFGVILVDNRLPYLFCLTFTTITAFVAGRGPALIVIGVGTINAILVLEPRFDFFIAQPGDRYALIFFTIATFCLLIGADKTRALYFRSRDHQELTRIAQAALRQRVADLEQLSGLSTKLALDISLQQRLQLILDVSVALHGASKGILSRFDPLSNRLSVVAIKGFNAGSFAQLTNLRAGEGACGLACGEGRRVTVFDVTHESEWEKFADLYRAEKIRGMHSTPIINQKKFAACTARRSSIRAVKFSVCCRCTSPIRTCRRTAKYSLPMSARRSPRRISSATARKIWCASAMNGFARCSMRRRYRSVFSPPFLRAKFRAIINSHTSTPAPRTCSSGPCVAC